MTTFLAHVRQGEDGEWCDHDLADHLQAVARLAGEGASPFGAADWASCAGLWHDLGKYSAAFQAYIRHASGYERQEAHVEGVSGRVDHSTAGALHAISRYGDDPRGRILAYLIAGHHAGLADWHGDETGAKALSVRLGEQNTHLLTRVASQSVPAAILGASLPESVPLGGRQGFAFWVRMLFSCLVDADFLDTEAFMDKQKGQSRADFPSLPALLTAFNEYMAREIAPRATATPVNRLRAEVLRQCRDKALQQPGLFSLTVPTGGGKTLSSLAFALEHAVRHNQRRIIYVIPYTSIIEQTADIFREIFGDVVIEHHSNLDVAAETHKSRLACENWDAPLIVTTNVQFFESLFAARTSRVRKLHNIAGSVVVLDEAQLLEPAFLQPILDAMNLLTKYYGVTFLLSTATQPALGSRQWFDRRLRGLDGLREIVRDPDELYRQLKRVDVELPPNFQQPTSWEEIAAELQQHASVLCIVNSRPDCRELHRLMPEGTVHLSALMCGEHRSKVIATIKDKLHRGEPIRVVSTQLVEAGVDLDFPVVYRAMAGLDSIAQAAGRCNREGRLERGRVVVFVPPKPGPPGLLRKAAQQTVSLLTGYEGDVLSRELFQPYFEGLYARTKTDAHDICELLKPGDKMQIQFRSAAERFRLIDDADHQAILVHYGNSPALLAMLRAQGPERWLMRKLQRYSVNLGRWQFQQLLALGDFVELQPGLFTHVWDGLYHPALGLQTDGGNPGADTLVI